MHNPSISQMSLRASSPTLTNPDMILPENSPISVPSPTNSRKHQSPPYPPALDNVDHGTPISAPEEKPRMNGAIYSPFRNGVLRPHDGSIRLRSSSEKGKNRVALEDSRPLSRQGPEIPIASSPTLEEDSSQRIYTESTKGDFDNGEGTYTTPAILEEDEGDPHSHAAMTRRAEEILANAKRRLTNMEGNLNRARSTLQTRASSSMSSYSPEPVSQYILRGKGRHPPGYSPSKHRQNNLSSLDEANQGHSRVFSETSVPSSLQTGLTNGLVAGEGAEASAGLGIDGVDAALRDRHSEPSRNWFWHGLARETSLKHANRHPNGLEALDEDGPAPSFEQQATQANENGENSISTESSAAATFNAQNPPGTGLTRARSAAQMHELREQMQDLKGKISTLKQRAREDHLRRRSLQSLRTPSPFTVAEQWHTGSHQPEDIQRAHSDAGPLKSMQSSLIADNTVKITPHDSGHASPEAGHILAKEADAAALDENRTKLIPTQDRKIIEHYSTIKPGIVNGAPSQKERLILVDEATISEPYSNDVSSPSAEKASPIEYEATEDSLYGEQDYHETSTSPIVERHEDRPDAFDYEHFILSSALGTYSGVGVRRSSSRRKRTNSQSSDSSVETTKPRNSTGDRMQADDPPNGGHCRKDSVDSISTTNTFATANEGADSDESRDDWTFGHTRAGSRQAALGGRHKTSGSNESAPDRLLSNGVQKHGGTKHIASVQTGYVNGVTENTPPIENGAVLEPPTDLLTVLSATSAWQEGAPPTRLKLGDRDQELVERLVKSLAKVCSEAQSLAPEGSMYEARVFRRKLDAARRMLDGEMNGEAF